MQLAWHAGRQIDCCGRSTDCIMQAVGNCQDIGSTTPRMPAAACSTRESPNGNRGERVRFQQCGKFALCISAPDRSDSSGGRNGLRLLYHSRYPNRVREICLAARKLLKVLHIEDDLSVARSISRALRLRGYEVVSAASRDEAFEHITVRGFRPDLILTDFDLGLRCCTGDLIVAEIAARLSFKPHTILLTGASGALAHRTQAFADKVLLKPVDLDALVRAMQDLLCMPT